MSRLSTNIYAMSGHFEPYSELEMRCLKYGDEVRKLEDANAKLKAELEQAGTRPSRPTRKNYVDIHGTRVHLLADEPPSCPGDGCTGCLACEGSRTPLPQVTPNPRPAAPLAPWREPGFRPEAEHNVSEPDHGPSLRAMHEPPPRSFLPPHKEPTSLLPPLRKPDDE